mmetsp:Transcript_3194/g.7683  ORF Transcript_3194/g.7683 Transcript_3194/m.7683 type:complete len:84 (+) Transcript_3194:1279-1530(+)
MHGSDGMCRRKTRGGGGGSESFLLFLATVQRNHAWGSQKDGRSLWGSGYGIWCHTGEHQYGEEAKVSGVEYLLQDEKIYLRCQ